jgi:hypothetical protein
METVKLDGLAQPFAIIVELFLHHLE